MPNIILDSRKLMVYEDLKYLAEFTGKGEAFAESLWSGLLENKSLYEEFLYYIDNQSLKDKYDFNGYSLSDLYVFQLKRYNLFNDTGKNTAECSREALILDTFMGMIELIHNPEEYEKKLSEDGGMDLF